MINEHSGLANRLNCLPGTPRVSHEDVVKSYMGLLCVGKSDFEAMDGLRGDDWFMAALAIKHVPSKESLRQRFDQHAAPFAQAGQSASIEMLKVAKAPVTKISSGHVPLDMDVFLMDNSDTKKECVSRTYKGVDGYAPIAAYLGEEGWCVGLELREGSQHSQKDFIQFLAKVVARARRPDHSDNRTGRAGMRGERKKGRKMNRKPTIIVAENGNLNIHIPMLIRRMRGRKNIIAPEGLDGEIINAPEPIQSAVVQAPARAFFWAGCLETGQIKSISDLAARLEVDGSYVTRILKLATLAPDIVEKLINGEEPEGLSLAKLTQGFADDWEEKRRVFE